MSEDQGNYGGVVSEPQQALAELSAYYAMVPEDLIHSGQPSAVTVYSALDRIARGDKTEVDTAVSFLAVYTGLSSRTVQRALKYLETNEFIQVDHAGPGRDSNRYFLPFRSRRLVDSTHLNGTEIGQNYQQTNSNQEIPGAVSSFADAQEDTGQSSEIWPDWYGTLFQIKGFTTTLEHAQAWMDKNGITAVRAEETAYALKSKWPGPTARPYRDPWATFQHWVKRPPLVNSSGGARRTEPNNDLERYGPGKF